MKQSIIELLKVRVSKHGVYYMMFNAMGIAMDLYKSLYEYTDYRDSCGSKTYRKTRTAVINDMIQMQAKLWELQIKLEMEDLEKLTVDYLERQELRSIPH